MSDFTSELATLVRDAATHGAPLRIVGGGTKDFYGGPLRGESVGVVAYRGIIAYDPTELVITARAGTPLAEIEAALLEKRQMLPFEPPRFGPASTLGGCIAAGLSGPGRAYRGAVRDFVLGVRVLDGRELHHGRCHGWRRRECGRGDCEGKPRLGSPLGDDGQPAVSLGAGRGGDPLGHLSAHRRAFARGL